MGWEHMEAKLPMPVLQGRVKLVRPTDPAAIDDHHPLRIVLDPTIVTKMTHGPYGDAQQRVIPGDAPVTPIAATRARLLRGSESDGVREELSLRFTATDDLRALASALTTAADLMEGTDP